MNEYRVTFADEKQLANITVVIFAPNFKKLIECLHTDLEIIKIEKWDK